MVAKFLLLRIDISLLNLDSMKSNMKVVTAKWLKASATKFQKNKFRTPGWSGALWEIATGESGGKLRHSTVKGGHCTPANDSDMPNYTQRGDVTQTRTTDVSVVGSPGTNQRHLQLIDVGVVVQTNRDQDIIQTREHPDAEQTKTLYTKEKHNKAE